MDNKVSAKKHKHLVDKIILKLEGENYFLPHNTYDERLLLNYISKKEYDDLINDAEKVISLSWISKRKYDRLSIPYWVYGVAILAAICFLIYMLLMLFGPKNKNGKEYYYAGLIFCLIGIVLTSGLSIYNFCRKVTKGKDLEVFILEGLENWCKKTNKNINEHLEFCYDKEEKILECLIHVVDKVTYQNDFEQPLVSKDNMGISDSRKEIEKNHIRSFTQFNGKANEKSNKKRQEIHED